MQTIQTVKKKLVVDEDRVRNIDATRGFYAGADEMRPPIVATNFYAGADEMRPPIVAH